MKKLIINYARNHFFHWGGSRSLPAQGLVVAVGNGSVVTLRVLGKRGESNVFLAVIPKEDVPALIAALEDAIRV